jgi:hypothetical protein
MLRALALVVPLVLAACSDTEIRTEGYDQTCETEADCLAVFVGDVCDCACEVDAINTTQSVLWAQERSRKQGRCDTLGDCAACPPITVACESGTCTATVDGVVDDTDTSDTDG